MPWFRSLAILLVCVVVAAADWPQWLGPNRDGSSPKRSLPGSRPKVLWRQPVGEGHSSPVVTGGKVFVHAKVEGQGRAKDVTAFDAKDGTELWRTGL